MPLSGILRSGAVQLVDAELATSRRQLCVPKSIACAVVLYSSMNSSEALALLPVCTSAIKMGAVDSGAGASGGLMVSARATVGDTKSTAVLTSVTSLAAIDFLVTRRY